MESCLLLVERPMSRVIGTSSGGGAGGALLYRLHDWKNRIIWMIGWNDGIYIHRSVTNWVCYLIHGFHFKHLTYY